MKIKLLKSVMLPHPMGGSRLTQSGTVVEVDDRLAQILVERRKAEEAKAVIKKATTRKKRVVQAKEPVGAPTEEAADALV